MDQPSSSAPYVDLQGLPERLFVTGNYPKEAHINAYNKPKLLCVIAEALKTNPQLDKLQNSCFGKLFALTPAELNFSGKLVLNFLGIQLITRKPFELWFVFAGKPLKFSIREFWLLTGLSCGQFPDQSDIKEITATKEGCKPVWDILFENVSNPSIDDCVAMLCDKSQEIEGWKKLALSLIIIVDGILTCGTQPLKPQRETVEMTRTILNR